LEDLVDRFEIQVGDRFCLPACRQYSSSLPRQNLADGSRLSRLFTAGPLVLQKAGLSRSTARWNLFWTRARRIGHQRPPAPALSGAVGWVMDRSRERLHPHLESGARWSTASGDLAHADSLGLVYGVGCSYITFGGDGTEPSWAWRAQKCHWRMRPLLRVDVVQQKRKTSLAQLVVRYD